MTSRRDTLVTFFAEADDLSGSTLPLDTLREAGCLIVGLLFWRSRLETAVGFFTVGAARYLELLYLRDTETEERSSFLLLS